jgi:regulator of nucleoside diphosphate kinase
MTRPVEDLRLPATRPPLLIRESDERRLHELAIGSMLAAPRLAGALLDELARAEVRADAEVPAHVVGLGSVVLYCESDGAGQRRQWGRLVAPERAAGAAGLVSIVSDLGIALIGLSAGQSILWPDRRGGVRHVAVLKVAAPAQRRADTPRAPLGCSEPPPVQVTDDDYERLSDLVCASAVETEAIALLWRELVRAAVIPPAQAPEDLVRMGSVVGYTDLISGEGRTARLAYPDPGPLAPGDVAVTSVLGAALVGLRASDTFTWTSPSQGAGSIRIDRVEQQPAPGR